MSEHRLDFVASLTVCPSDILKLQQCLAIADPTCDPLQNILITPIFAAKGSLELVREMAAIGKHVMFDSGGYFVQTGRISYEELFFPLLEAYKQHPWASVYVLPDHVPTSSDSRAIVDAKVRETARTSRLFFEYLSDDCKERAMPVVHGHTLHQVDHCLETYLRMGVRQLVVM